MTSGTWRTCRLWLREHRAEAAEIGAAGRRRVLTHFTWQAVVDRCLGIYFDRPGMG